LKALARSGPSTYDKLRPYLDVPQYIDYMTMFMFGKSEDEYRTTGPIGMGHGHKFVLNDADGYLYYQPYTGPGSDRTARGAPGKQAGDGPGSLFSMLYKDGGADYRMVLADRIQKSYVTPGGAMIDQAFTMEFARWNYVSPTAWITARDNAIHWFNGTGAGFTVPRTTTVLGHYTTAGFYPSVAAPVLSPVPGNVATGTPVTMTSATAGATIYYEGNGADPRMPGPVAPNATLVSSTAAGKFRVPVSDTDGITQGSIPNLVASWNFDADANDQVGGFNGTLTNGAVVGSPGRYGAGCLTLDGTNDHVALGNPTGLQILGQITMAAWVKSTNTTGLRNILNKGHDNSTTPNGEVTLRKLCCCRYEYLAPHRRGV
jgi:hypothetical protein